VPIEEGSINGIGVTLDKFGQPMTLISEVEKAELMKLVKNPPFGTTFVDRYDHERLTDQTKSGPPYDMTYSYVRPSDPWEMFEAITGISIFSPTHVRMA